MAKLAGGHSQGETVAKPFLRQLRCGQAEKNVDKQGTYHNIFAAVRENQRTAGRPKLRATWLWVSLRDASSRWRGEDEERHMWRLWCHIPGGVKFSIEWLLDLLVANNMLTNNASFANSISSTGKELMTVWRQYSLVPYSLWVKDHFTSSHFFTFQNHYLWGAIKQDNFGFYRTIFTLTTLAPSLWPLSFDMDCNSTCRSGLDW